MVSDSQEKRRFQGGCVYLCHTVKASGEMREELSLAIQRLGNLDKRNFSAEVEMEVENFNDIHEGDVIEAFVMEEVKR